MRLDALVLRAGFARTIQQARQVVVHRHILVDGKIVDRPSFRVKPGQTIQVKPKSQTTVPLRDRPLRVFTATCCPPSPSTWTSSCPV